MFGCNGIKCFQNITGKFPYCHLVVTFVRLGLLVAFVCMCLLGHMSEAMTMEERWQWHECNHLKISCLSNEFLKCAYQLALNHVLCRFLMY